MEFKGIDESRWNKQDGMDGENVRKFNGLVEVRPWSFPLRGTVDIGGDYESTVYTYDGSVIEDVRKGQTITVEAFCGECAMRSPRTGATIDSEDYGDVCVMYGGKIFGLTKIPKGKVKEAAKLGYVLRFKAKCHGTLKGYRNVKDMRILAPMPFRLRDWIPEAPDDRPDNEKEGFFSYNEFDEADYRNIAHLSKATFEGAKIEIIPTPQGSKAKPHIGVYSADGMLISEVAAKNRYYDDMLEYMGKYESYTVKATRRENTFDDQIFYRIVILGEQNASRQA